jgi:drug/metabolite transporter (DMT)-like permease
MVECLMDGTLERTRGALLAGASALSYSVTIVIGRSLAKAGLGPDTVLGIRFSLGGAVLLTVLAARRSARRGPLLPAPGERLAVLVLGLVGYGTESTLFYLGLEHGTAAAVTLLFYAYPAFVTIYELMTGRARQRRRQLATLLLAGAGLALVVGAGSSLSISSVGVLYALGAATTFAIFLVLSHRLLPASPALPVAAWTASGAGASFLLRGVVFNAFSSPAGHWPVLLLNGVATSSAFFFMYAALRRLGPSRTAVIMTLEAFFAVVLGAIALGESVTALQAVGGLAVLAAAALAASERQTIDASPARP